MTKDTSLDSGYSEDELAGKSAARGLERDESTFLISSSKVEGTPVYSTDQERIGHIDHLMIGKRSGVVEYAVMSFGGFLGMGEKYYPLPWEALEYNTDTGGYVVNVDKDQLRDAPSYDLDANPDFDQQYGQTVFSYYGFIY